MKNILCFLLGFLIVATISISFADEIAVGILRNAKTKTAIAVCLNSIDECEYDWLGDKWQYLNPDYSLSDRFEYDLVIFDEPIIVYDNSCKRKNCYSREYEKVKKPTHLEM